MLKKAPKEEVFIAMEQNADGSYYAYIANGAMVAWYLANGHEIGAATVTANLCNEYYHKDRGLFDEQTVKTCNSIRKGADGANIQYVNPKEVVDCMKAKVNFTGEGFTFRGRRLSWDYRFISVTTTARIGLDAVGYNPDNHTLYLVPSGLSVISTHYAILPIVEREKKEEKTGEEAETATTEEKPETAATAPAKSETSQATQASKERTENIMNENRKESKPETINTAASKATAPATAPARFLAPAMPELPAPKQEKKQAPVNLGMLPGVHYKTTKSADHINIWIFGNTKQHKETLKAAGFRWAPNWKGAPDRSGWYKREMIVQ